MALPVISPAVVSDILKGWAAKQVLNGSSYVAASVVTKAGSNLPRWNYYTSREQALKQLLFLYNAPGGAKQTAAGSVTFKKDGTAETFGINCDFFAVKDAKTVYPVPAGLALETFSKIGYAYFLIRMFTPDGKGPFYAAVDSSFTINGKKVTATGDKLANMKTFYENLEIIKGRYNTLVATLNNLIENNNGNPATQKTIDRLSQQRSTMHDQIKEISGATIYTDNTGAISGIGILPVIAIIAVIAIIGAAGWSIVTWIKEREKTDRIKASLDMQKLMVAEQNKLLADCESGKYPKNVCDQALKNIAVAMNTAQKVAEESAKDKDGMMGMIKIAIIALVVIKGMDLIKN